MTPDEITGVLAHGGGLSVDGSRYSVEQLQTFAAFAKNSGAQLTIVGGNFSVEQMQAIAAHGRGHLIFSGTVF
jgi:hypothetical protein